jgi:hypothetical protein
MKIILTEAYDRTLEQIEDFIFASSLDLELVERFCTITMLLCSFFSIIPIRPQCIP